MFVFGTPPSESIPLILFEDDTSTAVETDGVRRLRATQNLQDISSHFQSTLAAAAEASSAAANPDREFTPMEKAVRDAETRARNIEQDRENPGLREFLSSIDDDSDVSNSSSSLFSSDSYSRSESSSAAGERITLKVGRAIAIGAVIAGFILLALSITAIFITTWPVVLPAAGIGLGAAIVLCSSVCGIALNHAAKSI